MFPGKSVADQLALRLSSDTNRSLMTRYALTSMRGSMIPQQLYLSLDIEMGGDDSQLYKGRSTNTPDDVERGGYHRHPCTESSQPFPTFVDALRNFPQIRLAIRFLTVSQSRTYRRPLHDMSAPSTISENIVKDAFENAAFHVG